jgi:hypothetical protein
MIEPSQHNTPILKDKAVKSLIRHRLASHYLKIISILMLSADTVLALQVSCIGDADNCRYSR